jgi:hypothetical protein
MDIVAWRREKRIVNCQLLGSIDSVVERYVRDVWFSPAF